MGIVEGLALFDMFYLILFTGFLVFRGVIRFTLNYSHLLNSLLSLELMSVRIFFLINISFINSGLELFYVLYFLVILVCEGVLGLSLLIVSLYRYGEDYINSFSILIC